MIQRIQTVWLFLAAMMNGLLFIMKLYHAEAPTVMGTSSMEHFGVRDSGNLPLFIAAAAITILPLVAIFFFGDRKRQKGLVIGCIIANIGFFILAYMKIGQYKSLHEGAKVSFDFGLLLPIVAIVLLILAIRGINKDEKLIRSLDRLR